MILSGSINHFSKESIINKFIAVIALAVTLVSAAYAADDKSADKQAGMMQDDMMKNCQSHMKDGKMMDGIPKDTMGQCQEMMKSRGTMKGEMMQQEEMKDTKPSDAAKSDTPKAAGDADHAKHHPAQ